MPLRSWVKVKAMMAKVDQFLKCLKNYDKENIPSVVLQTLEPYLANPEFKPELVKSKSRAAAVLCSWVINVVEQKRSAENMARVA